MSTRFVAEAGKKWVRWVAVLDLIVTLYMLAALTLFNITSPQFEHRSPNILKGFTRIALDPVMEVFGTGKITHWFDWQDIDCDIFDENDNALTIESDEEQVRNFSGWGSGINVSASLGSVQQSAIILPVDYDGLWSLAFRDLESSRCQRGDALLEGSVKILVDGTQEIVGITEDGNMVSLELLEYINRNQRTDLPLI
jgi:hypothetical protein